MAKCRTLAELAKELGVSARSLTRWRKEWEGFPDQVDGAWESDHVREWHNAHTEWRKSQRKLSQRRRALDRPLPDPDPVEEPAASAPGSVLEQQFLDLDDESKRWNAAFRKARAEQAQLDLQERRGELIRRDEVEKMLAERAFEVRSSLMGMGRSVAGRCSMKPEREVESIVNERAREICEHFSRADPLP